MIELLLPARKVSVEHMTFEEKSQRRQKLSILRVEIVTASCHRCSRFKVSCLSRYTKTFLQLRSTLCKNKLACFAAQVHFSPCLATAPHGARLY